MEAAELITAPHSTRIATKDHGTRPCWRSVAHAVAERAGTAADPLTELTRAVSD